MSELFECFYPIASVSAEQIKAARKRIELEYLLYDRRKAVYGPAHISITAGDIYVFCMNAVQYHNRAIPDKTLSIVAVSAPLCISAV